MNLIHTFGYIKNKYHIETILWRVVGVVVVWHVAILLMEMKREKRKTKIKTIYFVSFLWQNVLFSFQFLFISFIANIKWWTTVTYPSTKYINFTFHMNLCRNILYAYVHMHVGTSICNINEIMYVASVNIRRVASTICGPWYKCC